MDPDNRVSRFDGHKNLRYHAARATAIGSITFYLLDPVRTALYHMATRILSSQLSAAAMKRMALDALAGNELTAMARSPAFV